MVKFKIALIPVILQRRCLPVRRSGIRFCSRILDVHRLVFLDKHPFAAIQYPSTDINTALFGKKRTRHMTATTNPLTQGNLWKNILLFSLPLMATNVLQVLFNMADIAVVGRFAGAAALGSVGSTAQLVALFTGFLIGIGSGVNALAARYAGANDPDSLRATSVTSAAICLTAGIGVFAAGCFGARFFLELLNTKEELLEGALLYLHIYFLGMPALAMYNYGNGMLSAMGETRRPLFYLMAAGVLNVGLNLLFVIGFDMAEDGVAWASVISQYLSAVLILTDLFRHRKVYGLSFGHRYLRRSNAGEILLLGVPAGMQNAIFQIANLFVQAGVNSFDTVVVEGTAAATNADALVYDVMAAFYVACATFMAQNYGAGKKNRILKSYFISLAYAFVIGLVFGVALVVFGRQFLGLFTTEEAVIEAGLFRLKVMGLCYCVSAFMDCTIAAARGLGKSVTPTVLVILGSCVFRIIWIYTVFAHFHTITSLYLLYVFSWTLTGILEAVYFVRCYRRQMQALDDRSA